MSVDLKRLAAAAAEAALSEDRPAQSLGGASGNGKSHGTFRGLRGLAAGAAVVVATRYAAKRAPSPLKLVAGRLPKPDFDFGELTERARDLIDDWFPEDQGDDYDDAEEEEPEDEGDYDEPEAEAEADEDEPEDEEYDEPEDEEYEEPEAEADAEEDEEPEDDEPEDEEYDEPEADEDEEEEDEEDEEDDDDYDVEDSERLDPA